MDQVLDQVRRETSAKFMGGSYDNLVPWKTIDDQATFRIVPLPFPWRAVVILNTLFVLFFAGWIFAGFHFASADQHALILIAGISIGLLTCAGFTFFVHHRFSNELAKGPWLVFDRASAMVTLSRERRQFPAAEIRFQLVYIQGASCDEGSELQLIADIPAPTGIVPQQFLLMTSIFGEGGPLETVAKSIQAHTPIKVHMVPMKNHNTPRPSRP